MVLDSAQIIVKFMKEYKAKGKLRDVLKMRLNMQIKQPKENNIIILRSNYLILCHNDDFIDGYNKDNID